MSATSDFYLNCAADSARKAASTPLENVRESCLRSEAAWRAMADRVIQTEAMRTATALAKGAAA